MFTIGTVNITIALLTAICLITIHILLAVMSRGLITIPILEVVSSPLLQLVLLAASIFLFLIGWFILIWAISLV